MLGELPNHKYVIGETKFGEWIDFGQKDTIYQFGWLKFGKLRTTYQTFLLPNISAIWYQYKFSRDFKFHCFGGHLLTRH